MEHRQRGDQQENSEQESPSTSNHRVDFGYSHRPYAPNFRRASRAISVLVKSAAGPLFVVLITALQDVFQEGLLELGGDEGD